MGHVPGIHGALTKSPTKRTLQGFPYYKLWLKITPREAKQGLGPEAAQPGDAPMTMMQCPSCSAPLLQGEARCISCHALVNPPTQGASALAPRLVTPQSLEGMGFEQAEAIEETSLTSNPFDLLGTEAQDSVTHGSEARSPAAKISEPGAAEPKAAEAKGSQDDAWRREVLERVRKRRQARTHALPLFVEGSAASPRVETSAAPIAEMPAFVLPEEIAAYQALGSNDDLLAVVLPDEFTPVAPVVASSLPDPLSSLAVAGSPSTEGNRGLLDFALRPQDRESPSVAAHPRAMEAPSQSLIERARPALVTPAGNRSLVADLPLVEPSRSPNSGMESEPQLSPVRPMSRVASMNDRAQAALIDVGVWSAMSAIAFYFASRIARTSIMGLAPAWQGLALFALVLGAAYILFFGGLSGATPGKLACGIQVRRYDGTSLGPLGALVRGLLGILSIALLGIGIWPAFWDKDRRTVHDRMTDARVLLS